MDQVIEDPSVGLVHTDLTRNNDRLEPLQELEPLARDGKQLRGPVAQSKQPRPGGAKLREYVDCSRNLSCEHFGPPPVKCFDQLSPLRLLSAEHLDCLRPGTPGVLVGVPLCRRYFGEEPLHLVRIVEELPVEVARVPIDKDPA